MKMKKVLLVCGSAFIYDTELVISKHYSCKKLNSCNYEKERYLYK